MHRKVLAVLLVSVVGALSAASVRADGKPWMYDTLVDTVNAELHDMLSDPSRSAHDLAWAEAYHRCAIANDSDARDDQAAAARATSVADYYSGIAGTDIQHMLEFLPGFIQPMRRARTQAMNFEVAAFRARSRALECRDALIALDSRHAEAIASGYDAKLLPTPNVPAEIVPSTAPWPSRKDDPGIGNGQSKAIYSIK